MRIEVSRAHVDVGARVIRATLEIVEFLWGWKDSAARPRRRRAATLRGLALASTFAAVACSSVGTFEFGDGGPDRFTAGDSDSDNPQSEHRGTTSSDSGAAAPDDATSTGGSSESGSDDDGTATDLGGQSQTSDGGETAETAADETTGEGPNGVPEPPGPGTGDDGSTSDPMPGGYGTTGA